MTFYVGQKVVCVDDAGFGWIQRKHGQLPIKGRIYTIRSFTPKGGVRLVGLSNDKFYDEKYGHGIEPGFDPNRFRPVVERKTNISIFTEILDRVNGDKPRVREIEHQS